jgi:hypothetical protein
MKFNKVIWPAALFLLLGGAQGYAQHEEPGKEQKPERKAEPQQARPQAPEHTQQPKPQAQQSKPQAAPEQRQAQRTPQPKPQTQQSRPQAAPQERQAQHVNQPKPDAAKPKQEAQQPQQKARPTQRAQSPAPAQHQQTAQQGKPGGQKTNYTPPLRTRQQATTWQQQNGWRQDGAWQEHSSWQQDRSSNWQSDHRTWEQRGGYGGYYIPQSSFSLHFGVGNWFRIQSEPVIVGGYPRFQYGGYSFLMVDPWPGDWAPNWYADDDVYVAYDNGYYLYNRAYPSEAIAITVVL